MSIPKWILVSAVLCFLMIPLVGKSAESSADVSASPALKESARAEVMANPKDAAKEGEYVIGIGDILNVSIYGEGDMAATTSSGTDTTAASAGKSANSPIEVRVDGDISLKHIGDVKAVGMTFTQLADYLKKLYAQIYDDPVVTAVLVRTNRKYSVMGKVAKPGVYPLNDTISLVQAIANSGGFTEWANREVSVIRKDVNEKDAKMFKNGVHDFDYDDFLDGKDMQNNIDIQANDVIVAH
jgi:polysaccharide biosynthesis/export protein